MRASPPHHRSFYFCSFSLCESTAKIPLGLALRRAGVRFIPGNRYPGMWTASIQCRVGMNAKLVGKTLKKIDSKIGAANRELKAGAADDERAQLLANECAGLVALAAQYGAVYVPDFASGGGALERKNWQLPAAVLDYDSLVSSVDGEREDVLFAELTDLISLRGLRGHCGATYLSKASGFEALENYRIICSKACVGGDRHCALGGHTSAPRVRGPVRLPPPRGRV